jgi:hypothetical protein
VFAESCGSSFPDLPASRAILARPEREKERNERALTAGVVDPAELQLLLIMEPASLPTDAAAPRTTLLLSIVPVPGMRNDAPAGPSLSDRGEVNEVDATVCPSLPTRSLPALTSSRLWTENAP